MKLNPLNQTFGLPPSTYVSDDMVVNSMPVMEITPGKPNFESGLTLFTVNEDWSTYTNILGKLGFSLANTPIKLAFIADNFPTDSFTNEYGETFLQKFTDVASQGMSQIAQMTGSREFTEALGKLGKGFTGVGEDVGGALGGILRGGGTAFRKTGESLKELRSALGENTVMGGGAQLIDRMLAGNRVDFPQIWRSSGFTPSYTATIRLYNPNPANPESTKRHIAGPLAVILCLAIPRSKDGKTFSWPFFHIIKAKGIYNLNPAVITNVTVIKGGDQQQISFNQKLSMVDVRIDFTSLYATMLLEEQASISEVDNRRPTVRNYLQSLIENDATLSSSRNNMRRTVAQAAGAGIQDGNVLISSRQEISAAQRNLLAKNEAARRRQSPTQQQIIAGDRVSTSDSSRAARIASQGGLLA